MKNYKSKSGKEFRIVDMSKPADGNIIYLTRAEYDWIKNQHFTGSEFDFIHKAKLEDHNYRIIPEIEVKESIKIAQKYSIEIIEKLKGVTSGTT